MRPESPDNLGYDLWYCSEYPADWLQTAAMRPEFAEPYKALLADIEQRGLVNPLIVLNHRDPTQYKKDWVMTGRNRLHAVQQLGWPVVPAIVTGTPSGSVQGIRVPPEDLQGYFADGEVYFGRHGPRLRGMTRFEKGEFPSCA